MSNWWEIPAKDCDAERQLFFREVDASEVEGLVNSLYRAGWENVDHERVEDKEDAFAAQSKYTVSATREVCKCRK